ncbi:ATP-dependent helicase HrpA [Allocatelliglobosispora scoriae]|uniref:RNA helicase n=1 Tax=Allocatelliglobosispora scoriae TaxID=643052 RepID=A0A841BXA2_9ACTN|nr:ATP-dependent helicase HrpA [Allocatelliglobosispora scoriae]
MTHDLRTRISELMPRDQRSLQRRLDGTRKVREPEARQQALTEIASEVERAEARLATRRSGIPTITYPAELPVSQRKDDLLAAIRDHQVVIVAGETGSGKTTQLPKICLELGRGVRGLIGHTQPRRIAARAVADRIAEELNQPEAVGFKIRFSDSVSANSYIKVMTDGILLAELQNDRDLRQYDTLIIDEAHERSLNIDFILGLIKQILPRRPDLKVIITSATIDPERFAKHFGDAPIVEVTGRTFPVEVRYRPLNEDGDGRDQLQAISDAVDELVAEGPGDILVFLSGEREIRDTADALNKRDLRFTEVLPLYARLSTAEQHRVFAPHTGRRIVLATNVAETSLTVPGIKYVIDPGTARISRYSHRTKVQRLPIEAISQASADQRKGRCGRVSEGICIRLYDEEDFLSRPEFTDPEILRTNLASVILQMTALRLGDLADFPFLDPPDKRNVRDGIALLEELGALKGKELTPLGRKLSQLPVDPRLARMVVEADRNGCLREVMVIVAALSIQDPRERPSDNQQAAAEKHARFADPESDFMSYLHLWKYLGEQQKELSSNQFRRTCKAEFIHYLRVREWQDIDSQLRHTIKSLGMTLNTTAPAPQQIHISLLSGLLSHIGLKEVEEKANPKGRTIHEYAGARAAKFAIAPGSSLFKKQPRWVMAGELVETSRLWARVVAKIEPEWIEPLAEHLVKRSYSEPHWERKQGAVIAIEKVLLYGLPIVAARKVNYGRIDPELSRELFIRHALVEGDWETHHKFFKENLALIDEVEELEHRARRRDILVDDETLFAFYDERIGSDVVSSRHFDAWWKKVKLTQPNLLDFTEALLVNEAANRVTAQDYPDFWEQGELKLRLTYQFEPGTAADGVTVHIPLPALNQVKPQGFDWLVPGMREDLITHLIRSLPKPLRRYFVPVPDHAHDLVRMLKADGTPMQDALARELGRMASIILPRHEFDLAKVPDHLRMTFRVIGEGGKVVGEGKDLVALQRKLTPKVREAISAVADEIEQRGKTTWTFGTIPRGFVRTRGGNTVKAFPSLYDEGSTVGLRVLETEAEQRLHMWLGTRRLILLGNPSPLKPLVTRLTNAQKLALGHAPGGSVPALLDDCIACAIDTLMLEAGGPALGRGRVRQASRQGALRGPRRRVHDHRRCRADPHGRASDLQPASGYAHPGPPARPRRPEGAARGAGLPRLRLRHRADPAAGTPPLPRCDAAAPGAAAAAARQGPPVHAAGAGGAGGVQVPPRQRAAHPLDDRGAPGQLLGSDPGHGVPRLRQAHLQGHGRPLSNSGGDRTPRSPQLFKSWSWKTR